MNATRTDLSGSALFIGHGCMDSVMPHHRVAIGNEKEYPTEHVWSVGGNAVVAAFACAHLGFVPDLLSAYAENDESCEIFTKRIAKYGIYWHHRGVSRFGISHVHPVRGQRSIMVFRTTDYLHGPPHLQIDGCRFLHLDGHQSDAALYYAKLFHERGIPVSLDLDARRNNVDVLLPYTTICIASEQYSIACAARHGDTDDHETMTLRYLRGKGCAICGVTRGERGMIWLDPDGGRHVLPAYHVPPEHVADSNGAGDVFRGAYIYSYLTWPERDWEQHFRFGAAAAAHAVQHVGNEASLPSVAQVEEVMRSGTTSTAPHLTVVASA